MWMLENDGLCLVVDPDAAAWSLTTRLPGELQLRNVRFRVEFHTTRGSCSTLDRWSSVTESPLLDLPHAIPVAQSLCLELGPDRSGLKYRLQFGLPSTVHCLLWNLSVENSGHGPVFPDRLDLLRLGLDLNSGLEPQWPAPTFFSNGWGSWNHTGAYGLGDRFRRTRLGPLTEPMRINAGTPHPRRTGHFSSDMFGLLGDRLNRLGLLVGFLSQKQHFGSLETWLPAPGPTLQLWANGDSARLDPGARLTTDWAVLFPVDLREPDPFEPYIHMVAQHHELSSPMPSDRSVPVGWCSWYHYYNQVSADDIEENLDAALRLSSHLPLSVLQIDDGFESEVGDWFEFNERFPSGVAPLAENIRAAGLEPGLWLAPFIVHPRSRLYQERGEWLLRGRFNRPVNAGLSFRDALCTALDLTHPDALAYAAEAVSTAVHQWNFPYLKLDFLYAGALAGRHYDPTLTRAQTLRRGLEALREAAGQEATLVGCGCPLGPAIGLFEVMRIGADVSGEWLPTYAGSPFFVHREPDYPSARNAIQNSLTRVPMHRRWWINDPDCLLVRDGHSLTRAEVHSLATVIAMSGGSLLLTERLNLLTEAQIRLAAALIPPLDRRPQILDLFDRTTPERLRLDLENSTGAWSLLVCFNWGEKPQDLTLRLADYGLEAEAKYWASEYWTGASRLVADGALTFLDVPPHGVVLCSFRPITAEEPGFTGSNLHISQGLEVQGWKCSPGLLEFVLQRPARAAGFFEVVLPGPPSAAFMDERRLDWRPYGSGIYRFPVSFERIAHLRIHYG